MSNLVIVDAYSTGRYLVPEFLKYGYKTVHVKSSRDLPGFLTASFPGLIEETLAEFTFDGNLEELGECLRQFDVNLVLPGSESGVALASRLAKFLGALPLTTGTEDSIQFRDKGIMASIAESNGVRIPKSASIRTGSELALWCDSNTEARIVVKPPASAGTDEVHICDNEQQALDAFSRIVGHRNFLGSINDHVIVQEYVDGTEFFVNSVSRDGIHKSLEIWKYSKKLIAEGAKIYDFEEPLRRDDPVSAQLRQFTESVLDALGLRNGPAHTEIMMRNGLPYLIESGARLGGSVVPSVVENSMGTSQVASTAAILVGRVHINDLEQSEPHGALRYVSLICHEDVKADSEVVKQRLLELPSVQSVSLGFSGTKNLAKTRDSATSPGVVYLAAGDIRTVLQDYAKLRELEKEGLYASFLS